jgi:hypothetical protein
MGYAVGLAELFSRMAKPGDIPIYQPTKLELLLNLKTAKSARPHATPGAARACRLVN